MSVVDARSQALEIVRELGPGFRERAPRHDREAAFPFENYAELHETGLLGLCVPKRYGGMGAGYRDYMHLASELGRFCPTTALTFNMHTQTVLWTGVIADELDFAPEERRRHDQMRQRLYARILDEGAIHAQPLSEGRSKGAVTGVTVTATPTDGGFRVSGRKIFASLAGAASSYNVTCVVPGEEAIRFLPVRADAPGVTIEGDWDTLGMRGTDSRTLLFENAFVPAEDELLPPGGFDQLARRWPHVWMTLTPTYVGLTRAVVDFVRDYLSAPAAPGTTVRRRDLPQKQWAWAEIQILSERAQAVWELAVGEAAIDPTEAMVRRALVATYTVMDTAQEVAAKAIRVCGGTTILKRFPLEQHYRDARCGALMLPWSAEVCLERLGTLGLDPGGG
jgi:alkylation response protein AidB-like acyl-CoA dehydrogenase